MACPWIDPPRLSWASVLQCGLELEPQYRLPKMRYKGGTPPPQRIRAEPATGSAAGDAGALPPLLPDGPCGSGGKPLIAEVGPDGEEAPAFALLASKQQQRQRGAAPAGQEMAVPAAQQPQPQQQQWGAAGAQQVQAQVEYCGKPATEVCITLPLPAAAAAAARRDPASIAAAVCGEAVQVQVPGCAPVEVCLPFAVSAAGGSAVLEAGGGGSTAKLVLRLPYHPFSSVLEELRQAAGAAEGRAPSGGSMMDLD